MKTWPILSWGLRGSRRRITTDSGVVGGNTGAPRIRSEEEETEAHETQERASPAASNIFFMREILTPKSIRNLQGSPARLNGGSMDMAIDRIRRRWTRRAIALLIVVNAVLWASFVLSGGYSRVLSRGHATARSTVVSPR
jgi:hypothetical protein